MRLRALLLIIIGMVFAGRVAARYRRISFRGKVAIITGGSRGLGLALARELGREGVQLELLARDAEELERAASSLRAEGVSVHTWTCDICDQEQIERTIESIVQITRRIDLLINNAGVILVAPLENLRREDFDLAMRTHFWGSLDTTLASLPYLKQSHGCIINISSIGGRVAVPHLSAYCASKFALTGLSNALQSELRKDGVHVLTVCPGLMRTGSHFNAEFKGDREKEFTWFSLAATAPLTSINAERAARQIIAAAKAGKNELAITLQARFAIMAQALFPNIFALMMTFINRVLPHPKPNERKWKGSECHSPFVPSFLTKLGDRAAFRLNEHPGLM